MLRTFVGCADASSAVALSQHQFVVANDEDSTLRIYDLRRPGKPTKQINLAPVLGLKNKAQETDLEGSARISDAIYWITSHARDRDGKRDPQRERLFATHISRTGNKIAMVGSCTSEFRKQMIDAEAHRALGLKKAAKRPGEDKDGFNIEALSATVDKQPGLYIGLRNPVVKGLAVVLHLLNPNEVIKGKPGEFGKPIKLDLGGRALRSMEMLPDRTGYVIVAGSATDGSRFRVYFWTGKRKDKPVKLDLNWPASFHPEGLVFMTKTSSPTCLLISDDGRKYKRMLKSNPPRATKKRAAEQAFQTLQFKFEKPS